MPARRREGAAAVFAAGAVLLLGLVRWGLPELPLRCAAGPAPRAARVTVRICGEVRRPGTYILPAPVPVLEAVRAAGGTTARADLARLDLSAEVLDSTTLRVPSVDTGFTPIPDLNRSPAWELELLPGIGPTLARRIVETRASRGRFRRWEDLLEVPGIGPVLLRRIRERARLDGDGP